MKRQYLVFGMAYGLGIGTVLMLGRVHQSDIEQTVSASPPEQGAISAPAQQFVAQLAPQPSGPDPRSFGSGNSFEQGKPVSAHIAPVALVDPSQLDLDALAPSTPTEKETAKLKELREEFSTLAKTKADLLNEKTLECDIAGLKRKIANLHAARKLLDAQQTLHNLILSFPDSPSAGRAKSMLVPSKPSHPVPTTLQPTPDPNAELFNGRGA